MEVQTGVHGIWATAHMCAHRHASMYVCLPIGPSYRSGVFCACVCINMLPSILYACARFNFFEEHCYMNETAMIKYGHFPAV